MYDLTSAEAREREALLVMEETIPLMWAVVKELTGEKITSERRMELRKNLEVFRVRIQDASIILKEAERLKSDIYSSAISG